MHNAGSARNGLRYIETKTLNNILLAARKIFDVFSHNSNDLLSAKFITQREESQKELMYKLEKYDRVELCSRLDTSVPSIDNQDYINAEKVYFQLINIGTLKLTVSIKLEQKKLDLSVKQGFGLYSVGYNLISRIARISNSRLRFKELAMTHIYSSPKNVMEMVSKHFIKNAMSQFYMIIGSSDLIGNPVGFIDKLGSGVYELVNEPKKGLLKGPSGFVGGVGKGVSSLVGNVSSATFGSFSKIAGSLYGISQDITFQEFERQDTPKGLADGLFKGAKGGVTDIASGILMSICVFNVFIGVSGIVTKPYRNAKKEGVKGFFKGLGKGALGAIVSPFSATLNLASNVTGGISASSMKLTTNKVDKQGRYRHPRYINPTGILEIYDEAISEAKLIILGIDKKKYADDFIRFVANCFTYKKNGAREEALVLIITDRNLFYVKDLTEVKYKIKVKYITDVDTDAEGEDLSTKNR